jgi:hypothetical protein
MTKWIYGHEEKDRDRGILSPADREFLLTGGDNLASEQSRRNTRRRIRNRIQNAIIDFDLITRFLDDEDKRLVFEEDDEWGPAFTSGQKAMVELLYNGLAESDGGMDFEKVLKSGVHDAELQQHQDPAFVNVEFDVDTDVQFDLESAYERFQNDETLTIAEIGALLATGKVDNDEVGDLAELAQEKGAVESSVSPMQAEYTSQMTDEEFDTDEGVSMPADAASSQVAGLLTRGEALMLTDAYNSFLPESAIPGKGDDESATEETADGD